MDECTEDPEMSVDYNIIKRCTTSFSIFLQIFVISLTLTTFSIRDSLQVTDLAKYRNSITTK